MMADYQRMVTSFDRAPVGLWELLPTPGLKKIAKFGVCNLRWTYGPDGHGGDAISLAVKLLSDRRIV